MELKKEKALLTVIYETPNFANLGKLRSITTP